MSLVNYVLVGLLGTIVGIALYMAEVDLSISSGAQQKQGLSTLAYAHLFHTKAPLS